MLSGDEYRKRANECIAAADKAAEPVRKVSLLELAQRWLRLAFQVDKIEHRKGLGAMSYWMTPQAATITPTRYLPRRGFWKCSSAGSNSGRLRLFDCPLGLDIASVATIDQIRQSVAE